MAVPVARRRPSSQATPDTSGSLLPPDLLPVYGLGALLDRERARARADWFAAHGMDADTPDGRQSRRDLVTASLAAAGATHQDPRDVLAQEHRAAHPHTLTTWWPLAAGNGDHHG